ncbi:E3 ubiquitin-protein ligase TRIM7-like isoform X1 [Lissotriton helveticus]
MEKKITTIENANIIKVSNQITSLNALIMEVEKMCEASAWDILKDVRSILSRCNNVKNPCPGMVKSYKVMVTLDPNTADRELLLSEGQRRVRLTDKAQPVQDTPKRFKETPKRSHKHPWVLGSKGFFYRRHYWEVQLLREGGEMYVGVAEQSVKWKNDPISWSPEGGVWAVRGWKGQYHALPPLGPLCPLVKCP